MGLAISVGYVQVRFGSSYFDVQLLNRGIDISDGRTGLFMYETEILEFAEVNFQTVKESDSVEKAVSLMSSSNQSELIVLDANEEFKGKINSLSLFNKSGTLLESAVIDTNSIVIEHDASLQSAMEIAADFVGEIIPIDDRNNFPNKISSYFHCTLQGCIMLDHNAISVNYGRL